MSPLQQLLKSEEASSWIEPFLTSGAGLMDRQWSSTRALHLAQLHAAGHSVLCISPNSEAQSRLMSELEFFGCSNSTLCLPSWETLPCEPHVVNYDVTGLRLGALWKLATCSKPTLVLTTVQSLQQRTPCPKVLKEKAIQLRSGQSMGLHATAARLLELGYEQVDRVQEKGQFAKRHGLIDLFTPHELEPTRLEWWGDEIEQMRTFDLSGQCSRERIDSLCVLPAQETLFIDPQCSVIDYLPPSYIAVFDEIQAIEDQYVAIDAMPGAIHATYVSFASALASIQAPKLYTSDLAIDQLCEISLKRGPITHITFEIFGSPCQAAYLFPHLTRLGERFIAGHEVDPFFTPLSLALEEGFEVYVLCASDAERCLGEKHLCNLLSSPHLHLIQGYLSESFVFEALRLVIAPMAEYTRHLRLYRPRLRISHTPVDHELLSIEIGEHIVHLHHGIAIYRGIDKHLDLQGQEQEFLTLEYAQGSKIYVPLEQSYLLARYQSFESSQVELHPIGSSKWKKQFNQAQTAIAGYAKQLVELYAKRLLQSSKPCLKIDSDFVQQFERDFPYELTEDQMAAIQAIKLDLACDQPMDRLICGDVGYGKTEVAMQAAFKVISDTQMQVALLAPTTVLALQHYETFCNRMQGFGVNVAVLSRFSKPLQRKKIIDDLADGKIDLLIGTHRLLSQDVQFLQLGLLIIDEEQRFGVKAKEHLKLMKTDVNCLTLSATPIPRTLHLSLMGGRQLSTIATPPHDRQPITTLICPVQEQALRSAILRELGRGGQIYYVHNDIGDLPHLSAQLQKLVPQLRIATVHGQMSPHDIESVFHSFKTHTIDLLLATTIIETGIDIPNANTIFISHADAFGLSDLYQLRGRVGRWNRKAYAYLLYSPQKTLSNLAKKRLESIQLASGYGAGMKVALRDLEIRGCGELIGQQQSGHVSSIGFSFYCKLLQKTLKGLQGQRVIDVEAIRIEHNLPVRLPTWYAQALSLRLEIYQRAAQAACIEQIEQLHDQIRDRLGPPPENFLWLLLISRVRLAAATHQIDAIKIGYESSKQELTLQFEKQLTGGRSDRQHLKIALANDPKIILDYILTLFEGASFKSSPQLSVPLKGKLSLDLSPLRQKLGITKKHN